MSHVKDLIVNSNARVLGNVITSKVVAPNNSDRSSTKYFATDGTIQDISVGNIGTGNAVTSGSLSGSTLILNKDTRFMFVLGDTEKSAVLLDSGSTASKDYAVAEGEKTTASGKGSHAEGYNTTAYGQYAHAEGRETSANDYSHAEGRGCKAQTMDAHAEGYYTIASGQMAHAEGRETSASKMAAHAEGRGSIASGNYSHAGGLGTIAEGEAMTAIGKYNSTLSGALFVVGNGTSSRRADALVLNTNNELRVSGSCYAPAFYESSDIRKKNIVEALPSDRCYDLIDKCQTIIYTLKDDPNNKKQLGLIAQEVEEFFPEVVCTDSDGFKTLDYSRLTVICLKIIKDLVSRVQKLESNGSKTER